MRRKCIVMPGFVDTHRHMWQGFLRNSLPDGSLADYIALIQRKFGANYVPEDVYVADLLSALGCIDAGVTTVLDWSHIQNSPEHTDACDQGPAGIRRPRGVRLWQPADRVRQLEGGAQAEISRRYRAAAQAIFQQRRPTRRRCSWRRRAARRRTSCQIWKAARDVGARITIHVGVGEFGRTRSWRRSTPSSRCGRTPPMCTAAR